MTNWLAKKPCGIIACWHVIPWLGSWMIKLKTWTFRHMARRLMLLFLRTGIHVNRLVTVKGGCMEKPLGGDLSTLKTEGGLAVFATFRVKFKSKLKLGIFGTNTWALVTLKICKFLLAKPGMLRPLRRSSCLKKTLGLATCVNLGLLLIREISWAEEEPRTSVLAIRKRLKRFKD